MKNILVYDSTEKMLERIAEEHDTTVAELLDIFLPDECDIEEKLEEIGL